MAVAMRQRHLSAVALLLLVASTSDVDAGEAFQELVRWGGEVRERLADGSVGPPIPGAVVVYVSEDGTIMKDVTTDHRGRYRLLIPEGRYRASASAEGYTTAEPVRWRSVVREGAISLRNFFLRKTP